MFDLLLKKINKWTAKRYGSGAARAMFLSANMAREKNIKVSNYSEYAKLAIVTRSGWSKISDDYFEHKSGMGIVITDEDTIKQITKNIVEIEIVDSISGYSNYEELLNIALNEVDKYFINK
jgi:hypothetical protein